MSAKIVFKYERGKFSNSVIIGNLSENTEIEKIPILPPTDPDLHPEYHSNLTDSTVSTKSYTQLLFKGQHQKTISCIISTQTESGLSSVKTQKGKQNSLLCFTLKHAERFGVYLYFCGSKLIVYCNKNRLNQTPSISELHKINAHRINVFLKNSYLTKQP